MKDVKLGFIRLGQTHYIREDAIVAIVFNPALDEASEGVWQEEIAEVLVSGVAEPLEFKGPDEIELLRKWVGRKGAAVAGNGDK